MKLIYSLFITLAAVSGLHAQTMRLIPFQSNLQAGGCLPTSVKNKPYLKCYVLEYTPKASGTLTGYTTGFYVSCTSQGEPIDFTNSCVMKDNTRVLDGCANGGIVMLNNSGNSGTGANKVTADVPVILHQVCFNIPVGESITVNEDQLTDLTTTIVLADGLAITEYPSFSMTEIKNFLNYELRPISFLDFKSIPAGDFVSQLDWTTKEESVPAGFDVERSTDGNNFVKIGSVDANATPQVINAYNFTDAAAKEGINYYRLRQVDQDGGSHYSPVRTVTFTGKAFAVNISPNPASEYLLVGIRTPSAESLVKILDASGRTVMEQKVENKIPAIKIQVAHLVAGTYTVVVNSGSEKFIEQVVIIK